MSAKTCTIDGCRKPFRARGWCSNHWQRWRMYGDPLAPPRPCGARGHRRPQLTVDQRLWPRVRSAPALDCWVWTGPLDRYGYARIEVDGRCHTAHRVAYQLMVGPVPDGLVVDHLCRNRACVNPYHLEPVTNQENVARGFRAAPRTRCMSGRHPLSGANLYTDPAGGRRCRACQSESRRRRRLRRTTAGVSGPPDRVASTRKAA